MTVLDNEREALTELIDGCIPDDIPGYRQRYTDMAVDAILAAGFRRQWPFTDEWVKALGDTLILRFHQFIHEDAPRDAIDQIARVALESARGIS